MEEKLVAYIRRNGRVSHADLEWFFETEGYDYKGRLESGTMS